MKSSAIIGALFFLLLSFAHAFVEDRPPWKQQPSIAKPSLEKSPSQAIEKALESAAKEESNENKLSDSQCPIERHAAGHRRWGIEQPDPSEYWFDHRIHTLGNTGVSGALHAALAPISTKMIDVFAYDGIDLRKIVAEELSKTVNKGKARVADLCCGVGISTRALSEAFPDAESVIGVDTSPEMVAMADFLARHIKFIKQVLMDNNLASAFESSSMSRSATITGTVTGEQSCPFGKVTFAQLNAEDTQLPAHSFDLVTVMYAFHEAPKDGRDKILREARRLLQPGGTLAIVDISTDFTPSQTMLSGEPYVQEYQQNIDGQLARFDGFGSFRYKTVVPGQVGMWTLKRSAIAPA